MFLIANSLYYDLLFNVLNPVNEPWDYIPFDVLREYYWRCYQLVQLQAPHWITLLHDSFRLTPDYFGSNSSSHFMQNCDHYAVDTHIYQAWAWENTPEWFTQHACLDRQRIMLMESIGVPVIVGEWSLATDNCAMWLNGFNDNGELQENILFESNIIIVVVVVSSWISKSRM